MHGQPIGGMVRVACASIGPRAKEHRARFGSPLSVSALMFPHVHCHLRLPASCSFGVRHLFFHPFTFSFRVRTTKYHTRWRAVNRRNSGFYAGFNETFVVICPTLSRDPVMAPGHSRKVEVFRTRWFISTHQLVLDCITCHVSVTVHVHFLEDA